MIRPNFPPLTRETTAKLEEHWSRLTWAGKVHLVAVLAGLEPLIPKDGSSTRRRVDVSERLMGVAARLIQRQFADMRISPSQSLTDVFDLDGMIAQIIASHPESAGSDMVRTGRDFAGSGS